MPMRPLKRDRFTRAARRQVVATQPRHPDLKVTEAFVEQMPKRNCRHCYERGTVGMDLKSGLWQPCRCLGKVSVSQKFGFHVRVDGNGYVHRLDEPADAGVAE